MADSIFSKHSSFFLQSTFNNVSKINHLSPNSNFHLFKQGIRPEWEDPSNAEGGKFGIQLPKSKAGDAINEHWMNLVRNIIKTCFTIVWVFFKKKGNDSFWLLLVNNWLQKTKFVVLWYL